MKKNTYIAPRIKYTRVALNGMLMASPGIHITDGPAGTSLTHGGSGDGSDGAKEAGYYSPWED